MSHSTAPQCQCLVKLHAPLSPLLSMPSCLRRFVFHGVHMLLQFGSSAEGLGKPWQPGETRVNRVVFIGGWVQVGSAGVARVGAGQMPLCLIAGRWRLPPLSGLSYPCFLLACNAV